MFSPRQGVLNLEKIKKRLRGDQRQKMVSLWGTMKQVRILQLIGDMTVVYENMNGIEDLLFTVFFNKRNRNHLIKPTNIRFKKKKKRLFFRHKTHLKLWSSLLQDFVDANCLNGLQNCWRKCCKSSSMWVTIIEEALELYIASDHRSNFYVEVSLHAYFILSLFLTIHSWPPSKTGSIDLWISGTMIPMFSFLWHSPCSQKQIPPYNSECKCITILSLYL